MPAPPGQRLPAPRRRTSARTAWSTTTRAAEEDECPHRLVNDYPRPGGGRVPAPHRRQRPLRTQRLLPAARRRTSARTAQEAAANSTTTRAPEEDECPRRGGGRVLAPRYRDAVQLPRCHAAVPSRCHVMPSRRQGHTSPFRISQ